MAASSRQKHELEPQRHLIADSPEPGAPTKDRDRVWPGSAMKGGKSVKVAVDFKGNVVSQQEQ